jgi:hypothetical protein
LTTVPFKVMVPSSEVWSAPGAAPTAAVGATGIDIPWPEAILTTWAAASRGTEPDTSTAARARAMERRAIFMTPV